MAKADIEFPTANRMGWTSGEAHEINLAFAEFAYSSFLPVLDVGAAFGVAALEALRRGARVIVNDLSLDHLKEFRSKLSISDIDRATVLQGKFPDDLDFAAGSLGAVHASNVLHFLTPAEFERALDKMHRWLAPGGKVFILTGSPYQQHLKGFIPEFERRKAAGTMWAGWVQDIRAYNDGPLLDLLPTSMLLFDIELLTERFSAAGFKVEEKREYSRSGIPEACRYDGRENLFLIASKGC